MAGALDGSTCFMCVAAAEVDVKAVKAKRRVVVIGCIGMVLCCRICKGKGKADMVALPVKILKGV